MIPSEIGLTAISFMLGFLVNEVARSNAYTKVIDNFSGKIIDAAQEVGAAKGRAETAATEAESLAEEITGINNKLQQLAEENSRTREQFAASTEEIEDAREFAQQTAVEIQNLQQMLQRSEIP